MAPGRRQLSKVQWGKESTAGTAVAATAIWRGTASFLDDQRVIEYVEEHIGIIGGTDRTIIPKLFGMLELAQTNATFEQLPYLFAMLLGGPTTGSADGSGSSGYKYTTNVPETSAPTLASYTIETGDDAEAEEMEYAHCVKITLSGVAGQGLKVSATIAGRQVTRTTFTGLLVLDDVEDILASKGKLYLDDVGGTIGTTQVSSQLLGFELTVEVAWVPKFTMDGNLYFSFPHYTGHTITGKFTYEHDSSASGTKVVGATSEKAKWRSQTPRLMRLEFTGGAYATAGTGTTFSGLKGLRIDLPIKYTKFSTVDEQDGNSIITAEWTSKYNSTAADAGQFLIANESTALT
jgi:hypothetical protein